MDLKVLGCHGGETPKHRTSSFLVDDRLAVGVVAGGSPDTWSQYAQALLISNEMFMVD